MFNLLAGQGLAFTGSKLIAFGLAPLTAIPMPPQIIEDYGGGLTVFDNQYSMPSDDHEIVEILSILFQVIE